MDSKISHKLSDGLLPTQNPIKSWAGFGSGKTCDGCDEPIFAAEVEHELDFDGSPTLRFHATCDAIWQQLKTLLSNRRSADPPLSA